MTKFNASKEYQAFAVIEDVREKDSYVIPLNKLSMNDYENYLLLTIEAKEGEEDVFNSICDVFNQLKENNREFADKVEGYKFEYLYATEPIIKDYKEILRKAISDTLNNQSLNIVPLNWYFKNKQLEIPTADKFLYVMNVANSKIMMWKEFVENNDLIIGSRADKTLYKRPLEGAYKLNVSKRGLALPLINEEHRVAIVQKINVIQSHTATTTLNHQILYWEVDVSDTLNKPTNSYQPIINYNAYLLEPSLDMNEWLKGKVGNELFEVYEMLQNRL